MGIIFYIGSVISTKLFGADFSAMVWLAWALGLFVVPDHDIGKLVDGNRAPSDGNIPLYLGIFVPFIMVTTFAVVNLLVGLIVNSMQDAHSEEADQKQIPIVMRSWRA